MSEDGVEPARLPLDVNHDLHAAWDKPVPTLRGIVGTPVFTTDRELATDLGYQEVTELLYEPVGEPVPAVPPVPTDADVTAAKRLLFDEWLVDFPFVEGSSLAHAIAGVPHADRARVPSRPRSSRCARSSRAPTAASGQRSNGRG